MSSTAYTQPFGSNSGGDAKTLCNDVSELKSVVVWRRNCSGILTILVECFDKVTCQCRGLCMTEVKSCQAVGWNGGPHWDSRGEVKSGVRDEGSVTVAVMITSEGPCVSGYDYATRE
jgi:hypothetical protein